MRILFRARIIALRHDVLHGSTGLHGFPAVSSMMLGERTIAEALQRPLSDDAVRPVNLHLDRREGLRVDWADGTISRFSLDYLRKCCPCATCRTEREEAARVKPSGRSLTILPANVEKAAQFASAKLVGNYAIQITWQDGHSTGIYDFRYLRAVAPPTG
jgi:DUF971 family protein